MRASPSSRRALATRRWPDRATSPRSVRPIRTQVAGRAPSPRTRPGRCPDATHRLLDARFERNPGSSDSRPTADGPSRPSATCARDAATAGSRTRSPLGVASRTPRRSRRPLTRRRRPRPRHGDRRVRRGCAARAPSRAARWRRRRRAPAARRAETAQGRGRGDGLGGGQGPARSRRLLCHSTTSRFKSGARFPIGAAVTFIAGGGAAAAGPSTIARHAR